MHYAGRLQDFTLSRRFVVAAYALVDAEDAVTAEGFRWHHVGRPVAVGSRDNEGRRIYLSRLVLGLRHGDDRQVDHINRNPMDNRRANLRIVSNAENKQNLSPQGRAGSIAGLRGVTWDKRHRKWVAQANFGGRHHYLGQFDNKHDAASAASAFRRLHMPYSSADQGA